MELTVGSQDELASTAQRVGGTASVEVVVAPGHYEYVGCRLVGTPPGALQELRIRGQDARNPPVFTGVALAASAAHITIEHIVFRGALGRNPILDLCGSQSVRLDSCSFIDNICDEWPPGEPLIRLSPGFGQDGGVAEMTRSWLIGNRERSPSSMIQVSVAPPGRFRRLHLSEVAMLGNSFTQLVEPAATQHLEIDHCVLAHPPGAVGVLTPARPTATVIVRDTPTVESTGRQFVERALGGARPDLAEITSTLGF